MQRAEALSTSSSYYLEEGFWEDARSLSPSPEPSDSAVLDRISLFALRPTTETAAMFGEQRRLVEALPDPGRFVRTFFFWTLLDQCLHTADPEAHAAFQVGRFVPKPCGILSSYWYIWHPRYVLYAGAHYESTTIEDEVRTTGASALEHYPGVLAELCALSSVEANGLWTKVLARMRAEVPRSGEAPPQLETGRVPTDPVLREGARIYQRLCTAVQQGLSE